MATKLDYLAADMERNASYFGMAERDLPDGLNLLLVIDYPARKLKLSRPSVPPSEQDIKACKAAFQIPETAYVLPDRNIVEIRWTKG